MFQLNSMVTFDPYSLLRLLLLLVVPNTPLSRKSFACLVLQKVIDIKDKLVHCYAQTNMFVISQSQTYTEVFQPKNLVKTTMLIYSK